MKNNKILLISNPADLDGWVSMAIMQKYYKTGYDTLFWNYGDQIPTNIIQYDIVCMCDISISKEITSLLNDKTTFIWIDHHMSSIEQNYSPKIKGIRHIGRSTSDLAYEYFFPNEPIPDFIFLINKYDTSRHVGTLEKNKVIYYQYGIRYFLSTPKKRLGLFHLSKKNQINKENEIIQIGEILFKTELENSQKIAKTGMMKKIKGLNYYCINAKFNPITMKIDKLYPSTDVFLMFIYNKCNWDITIYSKKCDCFNIAKKHGGKGHKGAAEFTISTNNFNII